MVSRLSCGMHHDTCLLWELLMELHHCDECHAKLGQSTFIIEWFEILYEFCTARCKTDWHMKKLAIQQRKYAGG